MTHGRVLGHLWFATLLLTACTTFARTPLHDAVSKPRVSPAEVRKLLSAGVDVNAFDPRGYNALMYAARNAADPTVVELLVEAGANVNLMSRYTPYSSGGGTTALHLAARYNPNPAVIHALIDAGARANEPDFGRDRPLHIAVRSNDPSVVVALVARGASRILTDNDGNTAYDVATVAQRNAMEREGIDLKPPVVVAQSSGDNTGKWIAGALMAGLLATQGDNIPADKLVEFGAAAAADLINETGGENMRRLAEEGRTEAATGSTVGAGITPNVTASRDFNELIPQMEAQCDGARYRGSRDPNNHNTTFQCLMAFGLECNLKRARNGGRSAEWIAAAERHLRTQCQRISELQGMGVMDACPHCSSTGDFGGCT